MNTHKAAKGNIPEIDPSAHGLIFDLDGTIADSMPVHFIAYQRKLGLISLLKFLEPWRACRR
jgi:hypothetical protein